MNRKIFLVASVLGIISIILGAFGAHALKKILTLAELNIFETGVRYQMYHALFLLFIGTSSQISDKIKKIILYLITIGVTFFSGSIYLLATNSLTNFDFKIIGFITPIGGLLLIFGWISLLVNFLNKKPQ